MMDRNWILSPSPEGPVQELARELRVSTVLAKLLLLRGVDTVAAARAFLNPSLDQLHDPMLLPQMDMAVARLRRALDDGEKILVYGDYDVDGTTAAALLFRVLKALNAKVECRVPHRQRDGYDLHIGTVEQAKADGVSLIVTVDCGSSAFPAVERARELGIDVVVTDHHDPGPELPNAVAVVNPQRDDSAYPFRELAGVGVALKLAQALVRSLGIDERSVLGRFSDLAALGTVADVMPLLGENRVIVTHGLRALGTTQKLGLRALMQSAGIDGKKADAFSLSFGLAPRLNAVGRMGDANVALKLLLTKDEAEAVSLAEQLCEANRKRKDEQDRILEEALRQAENYDLDKTRVMVLSSKGWHLGVIGIVAAKIVETYHRPAILIAEDEGVGRGSCRSIEGFHICEALGDCSDLLVRFGGHAMAAGFDVSLDHLESFREKINRVGYGKIAGEHLTPQIRVDLDLEPELIGIRLADELRMLGPFGMGNPRPVFVSRNVQLAGCGTVGSDGSHLKLRIRGEDALPVDCMGWRRGDLCSRLSVGQYYDLCYELEINTFNGNRNAQIILKDIQPTGKITEPLSVATAREE